MLAAAFVFAEGPSGLLLQQFTKADSIVSAFEQSADLGKCDSARVASALGDLLYQHPGFAAAALVGGGGGILASAAFEGMAGEVSGNVSEKEWFIKAHGTEAPCYSDVASINSRFCLVWSRPVYSNNALGLTTCRGILVIFVNIGECLKAFSASYRRPFELLRNGTLFYHSDDWRADTSCGEEPVTLTGNAGFTLRYARDTLPEAAPDTTLPDAGSVATSPIATGTETFAPPPEAAPDTARPVKETIATPPVAAATKTPDPSPKAAPDTARPDKESIATPPIAAATETMAPQNGGETVSREKNPPSPGRRTPIARRLSLGGLIAGAVLLLIGSASIVLLRRRRRTRNAVPSPGDLVRKIRKKRIDIESEELRASMIDQIKAELREEIRREIMTEGQAALREEARATIIAGIMTRLRDEIGGTLEREALQELTRTIQEEVRAQHEGELKERAIRELEEKIYREVEIRERSILFMQIRATLKAEIEKELRTRGAQALQTGIESMRREPQSIGEN